MLFVLFFEEALVSLYSHAIFLQMFIKLSLMSFVLKFSTIFYAPLIPSTTYSISHFWLISYFLYPKVTPNPTILFLLNLANFLFFPNTSPLIPT